MAIIKKYLGEGKIPSHYKKTNYCPKCGDEDSVIILEDYILPHDKNLKIENVKKRACSNLNCGYKWMHPKDEVMLEGVIEAKGYFPKIGQTVNCKNCDQEYEYFNPHLSDTKKYKLGIPQESISTFTTLKKQIGKALRNGIFYDSPRVLFVKEGNCSSCSKFSGYFSTVLFSIIGFLFISIISAFF